MSGKIAITGASGHVGYNLVKEIIATGEKPLVINHAQALPAHLHRMGESIEVINAKTANPEICHQALKNVDVIFHTGTSGQVHNYQNAEDFLHPMEMLEMTENLMKAAQENGVSKFIFFTSVPSGISDPVVEDHDLRNDTENIRLSYFRGKIDAESKAQELSESLKLPTCFVNSSMIIGPNDYILTPANRFILDLIKSNLRILPRGGFNPVDVRDVAAGLLMVMQRGKEGHRYVFAGDNNLYFREMANYLSEIRDITIPGKVMSKKTATRLASVSEWFGTMLGKPAEFSSDLVEDIVERYAWFDNSVTKEKLDWQPRPMKETLEDTVVFLEKHYV